MSYELDVGLLLITIREHFVDINGDKNLTEADRKQLKEFTCRISSRQRLENYWRSTSPRNSVVLPLTIRARTTTAKTAQARSFCFRSKLIEEKPRLDVGSSRLEMLDETFIDVLIRRQRRSKLLFASLTGLATCGGLAGLAWFIGWTWRTQHQPELLDLLPTLVSAIGLVPWKEMKASNDKIDALEMVKARLRSLADTPNDTERKSIEEMLWRCVENTLTG